MEQSGTARGMRGPSLRTLFHVEQVVIACLSPAGTDTFGFGRPSFHVEHLWSAIQRIDRVPRGTTASKKHIVVSLRNGKRPVKNEIIGNGGRTPCCNLLKIRYLNGRSADRLSSLEGLIGALGPVSGCIRRKRRIFETQSTFLSNQAPKCAVTRLMPEPRCIRQIIRPEKQEE